MKIAVINTNLAPGGKPAYLAAILTALLTDADHEVNLVHLGELDLPACDGYLCYQNAATISLTEVLAGVEAILLVSPVYNYDLNAAAKNLIELTGSSWKGKAVGLVCSAGANRSYLAPLAFMNSLAIDYRCLVSPRYVYVTRADFEGGTDLPVEGDIMKRLRFLATELPVLAEAAAKIATFDRS
jgi:NAD(P)H-dependent FMN reductase